MGHAIREQSDEDQDPREEFLLEYQEETTLEIHVIQLEAAMSQDTAKKLVGAHCSIVAKYYLDHHFPNWERQLFPTKSKNFKSTSGNITSIGTIIKGIIIPHRKGNIRLNPEFVVLEDAHIQGFLLGTDYQRIYGIDIYNSINRHITLATNKENTTLTSKQKLSLLKMLRKNRPDFAIGEEALGKIRDNDRELYLDAERPYPPMLRRPPYRESLETRK
ncbi:hypothetical protein O181_065903 [Austropuccinia psidii MF-1]|uniref:Uncharacterized protein n=1 Tax=Austropuccinia psidii MF-1 TaxID=1389203 RepID=A0A9Q3EQG4_9BASI|nr:hypothetical protein [Austropuccinia psidii MF-1]